MGPTSTLDSSAADAASEIAIRLATAEDDAFILAQVERFVAFPLPPWRTRAQVCAGVRADIAGNLRDLPKDSAIFIAEDASGAALGFLHLMSMRDFFSGERNAHISDLAVAADAEGLGIAKRLIAHAESFARERGFPRLTLAVFEGNARALALYRRFGFGVEMLRMVKPLT